MNAVDLNAVANSLWRRMLPGLRANMPEDIGADYFDGFVRRNGGAIVSVIASMLGARPTEIGRASCRERVSSPV